MTRTQRADERDPAEEIRAEVLASSLEALQARIAHADRQALRGAIAAPAPRVEARDPARAPGR